MARTKLNKKQNKLIIIIVIIMLFNFVMPNYSHGGILLNFFAKFLVLVPDSLLAGLQEFFVGDTDFRSDTGIYSIKFAPGVIFAGKIPIFNANFIKPQESKSITTWAIEPILSSLIENDRCYDKALVTKFDIGPASRTSQREFIRSR